MSRPLPPRYCDQCGAQIAPGKHRFCSLACGKNHSLQKAKAERKAAKAGRCCLECGAELPVNVKRTTKFCSKACKSAHYRRQAGCRSLRRKGGLLLTTTGKWPHTGTLVLTEEGIQFVAERLLTTMTFPQIAAALGVRLWTFTHLLLKRAPELTPYREKHHQIVRRGAYLRLGDEREATCSHCGATFTKYRNQAGHFTKRRWCDQCVTEQRTPKPPKALTHEQLKRRRKYACEQYQKHKEAKKQWYREYYARNRKAQVDKTRRIKAIKRHGLDREHWKEQWEALQATKKRRRKEQKWINKGRKMLAQVKKYLSQKV